MFARDTKKKESISIKDLKNLKKLGEDFDERLRKKADAFANSKLVKCKTKEQLKKALNEGNVARVEWCSTDNLGVKCAEQAEKLFSADVRGTMANKKEKPEGKCIICGKKANEVVYIGRSY